MGSYCGSDNDNDNDSDENDDNNEKVPTVLHVIGTIVTFFILCLSIQQLLGAPTNKKKVLKYRSTVTFSCFIAFLISFTLNFELEQDYDSKIVDDSFVYFVRILMILFLSIAFVLGYWFLIDAVAAAYKATRGFGRVQPPSWIRKFWLVIIFCEESILVLCFIFAFVMRSTFWLSLLYVTGVAVAILGSGIIITCVVAVYKSINVAIASNMESHQNNSQNGNNSQDSPNNNNQSEQRRTLTKARRTLKIMFIMGAIFLIVCMVTLGLLLGALICNAPDLLKSGVENLDSNVLDNPGDYLLYMALLWLLNLSLMAWTYRASNINYCCFCWQYKKYTTNRHKQSQIDENVVCYKCFPLLIERAEEKRQAIIEDSTNQDSEQ